MGPIDVARLLAGAVVLWGPFGLAVDALIRSQVPDGTARFALAAAGSYALTPAVYFLLSLAGFSAGLYIAQAIVVGAAAIRWWRRGRTSQRPGGFSPRPNWLILSLVALALFTTAPYTKAVDVTSTGSRNVRIPSDSLYYVSHAYEISRHLPVEQDPTRAGTPPRAYHLLPHVNTVLLSRATGEPDLLRAQIVYHLTILTVLVSTLLYALGKALTRRRLGGYALVALLYPLAVVGSPWLTSTTIDRAHFVQFYFTPLPQLSSMLDPVLMGSWQSYSAVAVALAFILAAALASVRLAGHLSCTRLLVFVGLTVATLSRFRIQIFMVAIPALAVLTAFAWLRNRGGELIAAGLAPLLLAFPLLAELASSRYRPGSSGMHLGFNALTVSDHVIARIYPAHILSAWPFSRAAHDLVSSLFSGRVEAWVWQVVCITAFVGLNMVGPLGIAGALIYLWRRASWSEWLPFTAVILTMVILSVLIGIFVKSGFDSYSLSGQALYLPPWYLFPTLAVAAVCTHGLLQSWLPLPSLVWLVVGAALVLTGAILRETGPASELARFEYKGHVDRGDELSPGRWETLEWIRLQTPADAVIMSNDYLAYRMFFSGLAGRATFLEGVGDIGDDEAQRIYGDDRLALVVDLWTTRDASHFCAVLGRTPSTHVVEWAARPLTLKPAQCLELAWSSPVNVARVWKVAR